MPRRRAPKGTSDPNAAEPPREVDAAAATDRVRLDARSLRGLAHPMRVRLLGHLRQNGPATASGLAAVVGESSGVTSYHLRQLAAYGFVVEDVTLGSSKRERWWRAAHRTTVLEPLPERDAETNALVDEYLRSIAIAYAERAVRWTEGAQARREVMGELWAERGDLSDWSLDLTPDEAAELDEELHALVDRFRRFDPDADVVAGRARVVVQVQVMPTQGPEPRDGVPLGAHADDRIEP